MRQSKKEIEKQYSPLHSAIEELGFVNIMKIYTVPFQVLWIQRRLKKSMN